MRGVLAVLAMVAACGDGVAGPDAAVGVDGPMRGRVTVHVLGSNKGFQQVFFQNADSTLALATRTNEAGDATALMMGGGFVSVVDLSSRIYTWTNVQPGDELTLDLSFQQFGDVFPNALLRIDPIDGAANYFLYGRCETGEVSAAITDAIAPFFQPCTSTSDLLLVASNVQSTALGYRFTGNARMDVGGTIDMRGPYAPFESTIDVIGPAGESVGLSQRMSNLVYSANEFPILTGAPQTIEMPMPVIPSRTLQTVGRTFGGGLEDGPGLSTVRTEIVWGPATPTTTIDLSPTLRDLTSTPTLNLESYTLEWSETEGEPGNVVWANIGLGAYQWFVAGARTAETRLRLPVLPHEEMRPRRETLFINNFALLSADGGYDRLRPYLLGHWSPSESTAWPMKEASGHVSYRSLQ